MNNIVRQNVIQINNYIKYDKNIIFLNSYPRSGNTWLRLLISDLILQNNGIEDKHWKELEIIFTNYNIKKIDLSRNLIGPTLGTYLGLIMRDGVDHIEWLDLSRNCFSNNFTALKVIYQGLKKQKNLQHFGMDIRLSSRLKPSLIPQDVDKKSP